MFDGSGIVKAWRTAKLEGVRLQSGIAVRKGDLAARKPMPPRFVGRGTVIQVTPRTKGKPCVLVLTDDNSRGELLRDTLVPEDAESALEPVCSAVFT